MKKPEPKDEIAIGHAVAPGVHVAIRRQDGEEKRVLVHAAEDGETIRPGSELAIVGDPTDEQDGVCWQPLESIYKNTSGPAQVATPAYRDGYDRIFGKKQKVGIA